MRGADPASRAPRLFSDFLFILPFLFLFFLVFGSRMSQLSSLALLLVAICGGVSASIGPGATLLIANDNIAPDGFPRP
jgi:hypothetical protein